MVNFLKARYLAISSILLSGFIFSQGCHFLVELIDRDGCPERQKSAFKECIEERFPVGSDYRELEDYLNRSGFRELEDTGDYYDEAAESEYEHFLEDSNFQRDELVYFDFTWFPKFTLVPVPYSVRVRGFYDENFVIITIFAR